MSLFIRQCNPCLIKIDSFLLHRLGDIVDVKGNFSLAEFRGIERLQIIVVEGRIRLRQTERFVGFAVFVDIAEVRFAIETVVAFRGKDKPAAI